MLLPIGERQQHVEYGGCEGQQTVDILVHDFSSPVL
jgi:hypothetical protein